MMLKLTIDELPDWRPFYVILTDLKAKIIVRAILNSIHVRWSFKQYKGRDGVFFDTDSLLLYQT